MDDETSTNKNFCCSRLVYFADKHGIYFILSVIPHKMCLAKDKKLQIIISYILHTVTKLNTCYLFVRELSIKSSFLDIICKVDIFPHYFYITGSRSIYQSFHFLVEQVHNTSVSNIRGDNGSMIGCYNFICRE